MLYLAVLAGVAADEVDILVDGYAYGSLSMTSYTLGLAGAGNVGIQVDAGQPVPDFPPTPPTSEPPGTR